MPGRRRRAVEPPRVCERDGRCGGPAFASPESPRRTAEIWKHGFDECAVDVPTRRDQSGQTDRVRSRDRRRQRARRDRRAREVLRDLLREIARWREFALPLLLNSLLECAGRRQRSERDLLDAETKTS